MMIRRKSKRRRSGAAALEMAIVLPVYTTLIFGQLETARLGMVEQLLNVAAREGCRVAVINGKTQTDVQNRINTVLNGTGINVGTVNPSPSNWASSTGGTAISVTLSVPYNNVSWLQPPLFFAGTTVTGTATMSSERP
jgi:Flp pilus assembly protein TadG